jgi:hypothetical protein
MIIIQIIIGKSKPKGNKLKKIIAQINHEATSFSKVSYYHIKIDLNEEVGQCDN